MNPEPRLKMRLTVQETKLVRLWRALRVLQGWKGPDRQRALHAVAIMLEDKELEIGMEKVRGIERLR